MIKEFEINDILRATEAISNVKGEKGEIDEKKYLSLKKHYNSLLSSKIK